MKKFTKVLLMAALGMTITGAAFCVVSLCIGFTPAAFRAAAQEGKLQTLGADDWTQALGEWVNDITVSEKNYEKMFDGIEELDLDAGVADCTLIPYEGSVWKVEGRGLPGGFRCEQDGNELKIDCQKNFLSFFGYRSDNAVLEIYIPQEQVIEKVRVDVGVGTVEVPEGMLTCEELEIDNGVGEITVQADIKDSLEIDGGVGDCYLTLKGKEQDFDYDLDYGVGEIVIDGTSFRELGGETKIDNHASKEIKIDSGVGNVEIEFEQ